MAKKMLIDATHAEETRVVVVDGNKVEEFDFESENKRQLAGNIYLAKVTRVEPSLQAAFVDYGGNRHGFLAFSEIHPDYYQIPVADREALMEEERAYAEAQKAEDEAEEKKPSRRRRSRSKAASTKSKDAKATKEVETPAAEATAVEEKSSEIAGMETIDLTDAEVPEGSSPMETVAETPVEEPSDTPSDAPVEAAAEPADAEAEAPASETQAEATVAEDAVVTAEAEAQEETVAEEAPAEAAPVEAAAEDTAADAQDAAAPAETPAADTDADTAATGDADKAEDTKADDAKVEEAKADDTDAEDGDDADEDKPVKASDKDASIESVADEDDIEDIRPRRKPRPRRYKIQEVIKVRQILLVQVVKEERGNKGAALTTYLSLAGRYCVLMPNTARGGGISRKITNAVDRKKLKEIATELDVPQGAGLIVRTAGAKRTKSEIKRDYEYLQRLWEQIRELTLQSIAPAKIYEEGDLIKRSIRDLYSRDIDEVLVEGERGYRIAKDFMKMIMPSHAKNVQNYHDAMPLFARFQVESYLAGMFNPVVQLKSGGYIVIDVTEALVAVDVNSGRATKEGSIEDTATKTNLEAAEEVARQVRLRDLAGLIVIDFIDMDERRNNNAVEKRLKDKLKTDRARIQIGRISGFGLLEMSRQRLRPGMIEATTKPCPSCHGTGLIRSDDNLALSILRQIEEEGVRRRSREVLVKCPVGIANYIMNQKREHVAQIETRYGLSVRIEGDPHLVSPDFTLEKLKTATRVVPEPSAPVVSVDTKLMAQVDEDAVEGEAEVAEATAAPEAPTNGADASEDETKPKKRRRRRRRRKSSGDRPEGDQDNQDQSVAEGETPAGDAEAPAGDAEDAVKAEATTDVASETTAQDAKDGDASEEAKPTKPKRTRTRRRKPSAAKAAAAAAEAEAGEEAPAAEAPVTEDAVSAEAPAETADTANAEASVEAPAEAAEAQPEPSVEAPVEESAETPAAPVAEESVEEAAVEPAAAPETAVEADAVESAEAAPEPEVAIASPEPEPEAVQEVVAAEPKTMSYAPEEPAKPKKRGWWSLG
ncbi:MAG: Rne/Rng family ribonuclease [Thalassovita sp.]